MNKDYYYYH